MILMFVVTGIIDRQIVPTADVFAVAVGDLLAAMTIVFGDVFWTQVPASFVLPR